MRAKEVAVVLGDADVAKLATEEQDLEEEEPEVESEAEEDAEEEEPEVDPVLSDADSFIDRAESESKAPSDSDDVGSLGDEAKWELERQAQALLDRHWKQQQQQQE